jgi:hypothetical protein
MKTNIAVGIFFLLVVFSVVWVSILLITAISKDIRTMVDWNDNIVSNNGTVVATGAHISIWKDGGGKMHAGFMAGNKQYELQVVE